MDEQFEEVIKVNESWIRIFAISAIKMATAKDPEEKELIANDLATIALFIHNHNFIAK